MKKPPVVDVASILSQLGGRLIGYRLGILQALLAATLAGRNVLVLGRQGVGKSTIVRLLARLIGASWVHYFADRDDMISVAGIPQTDALARGEFAFAKHDRTIWDKIVVLVDEISRATPENQNIWLEIFDSKTLYGIRLKFHALLATCNPGHYAATRSLDDALLDRFHMVLETPDFQKLPGGDIEKIVGVNLALEEDEFDFAGVPSGSDLRKLFSSARNSLLSDSTLSAGISKWVGLLLQAIEKAPSGKNASEVFISPRTFGSHLPTVLLDLCALDVMSGRPLTKRSLLAHAELAAHLCLEKKCQISAQVLRQALRAAASALDCQGAGRAMEKLQGVASGEAAQRIDALRKLEVDDLTPEERARLDLLARKLIQDVMADRKDTEAAGRLWNALSPFPEVRVELETALLSERLQSLAEALDGRKTGARKRAVRELVQDPANWAPDGKRWLWQ